MVKALLAIKALMNDPEFRRRRRGSGFSARSETDSREGFGRMLPWLIRLVPLLVLWLVLAGCNQREPQLRIGANVWPGYEAMFLARSLGYYDSGPIQLLDFPSSTEVLRAYRNRAIDVAAVTADEALLLAETDPDQQIVLVCDFSNGADVLLAKPEFKSIRDLRGHRIGVEAGALGAYFLARALASEGMTARDVTLLHVPLDEHEDVYLSGKVDAVVTFEPRRTRLLAAGARILFDSSRLPGEILDVLVTRNEVASRRRDALSALVDGWFRALEYLRQHPVESARLVVDREHLKPEEFLAALKLIQQPDRAGNARLLGPGTNNLLGTLRRLSGVMVENKLLGAPVDPAPLLNDHFVRQHKP